MYKRVLSSLLCLGLMTVLFLPVCVFASPQQVESTQLHISGKEEFLEFTERCRLDTYSQQLSVYLEADIDLTGVSFTPAAVFSGFLEGNGHTISGLSIAETGSDQGLFRYLTASATVQNLSLSGEIMPQGSQSQVGALAGRNDGTILGCSFSGTVSGKDYVGGLVGRNSVTGVIDNCTVSGSVYAHHFVGGIAGENSGVIRSCENLAVINTTPQQNSVGLSDITVDTLLNSEAAATATDIGGIAGISTGVIRRCENRGDVGYPQMGYNIGGIVGTQSGYLTQCVNYGNIQGRKEVGGIAGQMEPASVIRYTEDTLQILQGQLGTMSGMVSQASGNAQANASQISGQISALQDQAQAAREAVDSLIPDKENTELPDLDTILAAQNTLSAALDAMPETISGIASATKTTVGTLSRDLGAISGQLNAMGQTVQGGSEALGFSITDVSDQDTQETLSGKAEGCINYGSVLADLNAGGISGAMAVENDLDITSDWKQAGEQSLNFDSQLRAVVLNCQNYGTVTIHKQNAGGIVGWQSMGLVKNCINTGNVEGSNANYIGGISGRSTGFIRSDYTKCIVSGKNYVGGIAGSATVATDNRSQVKLVGSEKLGATLGVADQIDSRTEKAVSGNYYLAVGEDPGAIDGICYSGAAEALSAEEFLKTPELPEIFQKATVRFIAEDSVISEISVATGSSIAAEEIPAVPEKSGYTGIWEGLCDGELTGILLDKTFRAVYTGHGKVISSDVIRENGLPLLLAEGAFTDRASLTAAQSAETPEIANGERLVENWSFTCSEGGTKLRFHIPGDTESEHWKLMLCGADGTWRQATYTIKGSYLVFDICEGDTHIAIIEEPAMLDLWLILGTTIAVLAVLTVVLMIRLRKGRTAEETEVNANH